MGHFLIGFFSPVGPFAQSLQHATCMHGVNTTSFSAVKHTTHRSRSAASAAAAAPCGGASAGRASSSALCRHAKRGVYKSSKRLGARGASSGGGSARGGSAASAAALAAALGGYLARPLPDILDLSRSLLNTIAALRCGMSRAAGPARRARRSCQEFAAARAASAGQAGQALESESGAFHCPVGPYKLN
jgi:hypothetical protein